MLQNLYDIRFDNGFLVEERRSVSRAVRLSYLIVLVSAVISVCAVVSADAIGAPNGAVAETAAEGLS